jgi:Zn-dependent protease
MDLNTSILLVLAIIPSLAIHEAAHGWMALRFGDDTAKQMGRVTLNPIPHIDPLGLLLPLMGFPLGWAKPVPVNPFKVRNPGVGLPAIAAAGPASNILQMLVGGLVFMACNQMGWLGANSMFTTFLFLYVTVNLSLALFNLIPLAPLDGSKILSFFMPEETAARYEAFLYRVRVLPLIVLIVLNMLTDGAILRFWFSLFNPIFAPIFALFGLPLYWGN